MVKSIFLLAKQDGFVWLITGPLAPGPGTVFDDQHAKLLAEAGPETTIDKPEFNYVTAISMIVSGYWL